MTDKVSEGDVADATRSHKVETKQTLAPTLEDGTLRTADDGEPTNKTDIPTLTICVSILVTPRYFDEECHITKSW